MVRGLDKFKEYFKGYENNYVVIGGTACDVILTSAALKPRSTKDIDIVLIVEALSKEFVSRFWEFIEGGKYESMEKEAGERKVYRFKGPAVEDYPQQVELFSRIPDLLDISKESRFTPVPVGDGVPSLSAILMDDNYYHTTIKLSAIEEGLKRAGPEALICLKAKAFLNMTSQKINGGSVSDGDIKKHKYDVFRMALVLTEDTAVTIPASIKNDLHEFIESVRNEPPGPEIFKALGTGPVNPSDLIQQIERSFGLDHDLGAHTDRKIAAFKRKQPAEDISTTKLGQEVLIGLVKGSLIPLMKELESKCKKLQEGQFNEGDRQIWLKVGSGQVSCGSNASSWEEIEAAIVSNLSEADNLFMSGIDFNYQLRGNRKSLEKSYATAWLQFQFQEYSYSIRLNQDWQTAMTESYDSPLGKARIDAIVGALMDKLIEQLS